MLLEGKVAVITGSASGIGRAGALLFAKEKARVVVADIDGAKGRGVVEEIIRKGQEACFAPVDLCSLSQINSIIQKAVSTYGRLDVFWHNAGTAGPGSIEETEEEDFDKTMAVNLKAAVFCAQAAIPEMRKLGRGCMLFTSSISGLKPSPFSLAYSLTKAGLLMLTRCLAVSLAKDNIRVNAICPGLVDTPLLHSIAEREGMRTEELRKVAEERIPLGRYISEEEVANGALFLASNLASAITGVCLPVDCGMAAD
ncbi:MAG: SDR family oxidoreductase [Syntrophaceae bacterium]|nr:SDR family oxidoreductase [Syntrophaceae bacterium]